MKKATCWIAVVFMAVGVVLPVHGGQPFFAGLGDLPGGDFQTGAYGISADGSVVVGYGVTSQGAEAFRWTRADGMVGLGDLPGGGFGGRASGVSADGSVIVGASYSASGWEAFRWTAGEGMVGLGDLAGGYFESDAHAVSADGSTIVGAGVSDSGPEAFRWTESGGMVGLGALPGGTIYSSEATGVSADGSVIVGQSSSAMGTEEAFRWTEASGLVGLGDLPGSYSGSRAWGVSSDGAVVVGGGRCPGPMWPGHEAFRWTTSGGMVGLGDLPGGAFDSEAIAVSADGSVVVGASCSRPFLVWPGGFEAFVWDAEHGMRNLRELLVNEYGLDLSGWTLIAGMGVSADGSTIIGNGRFEYAPGQFRSEGWIVHLPEPTSLWFLVAGGLLALGRRRRGASRSWLTPGPKE